ncbi:O-antigen ligase family protein [Lachnospiraceae bacterium ZAX-1]
MENKVQKFLFCTELLLLEIIFLALFYFLCQKIESPSAKQTLLARQEILIRIRNIGFGLLLYALFIFALTAGIANFLPETAGKFHWIGALKLEDSFGSNRGYIWKRTVWEWRELPLIDKLSGVDLNRFPAFINKTYRTEMPTVLGKVMFLDAHNEFLQFLVTTGLLGVVGYFGMLVSSVVRFWKLAKERPILLIGSVTALSYLMQGLVNNPQTFTTPLLFVFFWIMENIARKGAKMKPENPPLHS